MRKIIRRSCEDDNTIYVCIGKRRFVYQYGKYIGWYKP